MVEVRVGPLDEVADNQLVSLTRITHGEALNRIRSLEPHKLHWIRTRAGDDALDFAFGTPEMEVQLVRQMASLFAEELEAWLSETSLAWGQLRRVKPVEMPGRRVWD